MFSSCDAFNLIMHSVELSLNIERVLRNMFNLIIRKQWCLETM